MAELAPLRQRPFLTLSFAKKLHQKTPYAAPATTPTLPILVGEKIGKDLLLIKH